MFTKRPKADPPSCAHDTASCKRYQWWIKQQGKTVKITRGAFAGYIGRLHGVNYNYGVIAHRAGCYLHASIRHLDVAYVDLQVVDENSTPPKCCECCCGYCNHCGHGLIGGECDVQCHGAPYHPEPLSTEEQAKYLTKLVLFGTAYNATREQIVARVQERLEQYRHLNSECHGAGHC